MDDSSPSRQEKDMKEAYDEAVRSFAKDMPLLMHGSGDVLDVRLDTVHVLSSLTAQYISNLVDAALDCQSMLQDGGIKVTSRAARTAGGSGQYRVPVPPPPRFKRSRVPPIPPVPENFRAKRKLHKSTDEYWDEPLPEPKIRRRSPGQEPADQPPPARGAGAGGGDTDDDDNDGSKKVHIDEWVGIAGVDLSEGRARSAYVGGPSVLSTQSFVFPICHDVYAYGRVMEVQTAKRTLAPILLDPAVAELVKDEEERMQNERNKMKKLKKKKLKMATEASVHGNTSDPEEDEDEIPDDDEEQDTLAWPGLESLLPVHRSEDWPA